MIYLILCNILLDASKEWIIYYGFVSFYLRTDFQYAFTNCIKFCSQFLQLYVQIVNCLPKHSFVIITRNKLITIVKCNVFFLINLFRRRAYGSV